MDVEILDFGTSYHDPTLPPDQPTYQYTIVDIDYWDCLINKIDFDYQILMAVFMPEDDDYYFETKSAIKTESAYNKLLRIAYQNAGMVEMPIAVAPEFDSTSAPYPGPFEKEKMLAVFAEIRYAVQGSSFAPFLDLKLGPAYNLDSKRYKNAFVRPSAGICFGHLSVSAGVEAAIGEYVDERYRDKKNLPAGFSSDITYGLCESFLPYVSVGYHF